MSESDGWSAPQFPNLRRDLTTKRVPNGEGFIYKVRTPESPTVCQLYDVELAVVRLMNGKRDLDAIVEEGRKQGLPITRPLLEKFIRELAAYHFLENAEPLPAWGPVGAAPAPAPVPTAAAAAAGAEAGQATAEAPAADGLFSPSQRGPTEDTGERPWTEGLADVTSSGMGSGAASSLLAALESRIPPVALKLLARPGDLAEDLAGRLGLDDLLARPVGWRAVRLAPWAVAALLGSLFFMGHGHARGALTLPCRLAAHNPVDVHPPQGGVLKDIDVVVGQPVRQGDLLARLQDGGLANELEAARRELKRLSGVAGQDSAEQAEADLAALRQRAAQQSAEYAAARREVARLKKLPKKKRGGLSRAMSDLKRIARDYSQTRAQLAARAKGTKDSRPDRGAVALASARAKVDGLAGRLAALEVHAPADGIVTAIAEKLRAGDPVRPEDALMQLASVEKVEAELWLPVSARGAVTPGTAVDFTTSELASESARGAVVAVSSASTRRPEGDVVRVVAEIDNPHGALRPGMLGTALVPAR